MEAPAALGCCPKPILKRQVSVRIAKQRPPERNSVSESLLKEWEITPEKTPPKKEKLRCKDQLKIVNSVEKSPALVAHVLVKKLDVAEKPSQREPSEAEIAQIVKSGADRRRQASSSEDSEGEDIPMIERRKVCRKRRATIEVHTVRDLNANQRLFRSGNASMNNSATPLDEDTLPVIKHEPLDIPQQDTVPLEPFSGTFLSILTVQNSQIVRTEDFQENDLFATPEPPVVASYGCANCGKMISSPNWHVSHHLVCGLKKRPQFNFAFDKALVAKLSEHFSELQRDEQSAWQKIALELAEDPELNDVELQCWKDLRAYFKQSLVFQIKRKGLSHDQEFIDRLQYPYLRKVYCITISFVDKVPAKVVNRNDNIKENKLFIKSVIDGTYDPDVVAAYKRRRIEGKRVYVNINLNDPRYDLSVDQRELLMQIEQNRTRKANKRGRQLEAGTWHDVANNGSPVMLDGVPVTIENAVSPVVQASNGSARRLLDEESLYITTQQYDQMIKDSLDPELPLPPKRRCFTVDSNVDSEEEDELDVSSASETNARNLTSAGSECEEDIIFIDLNEIMTANASINASRDPLQTSIRQPEINSSQAPILNESVDDRGVGTGGEKDSTTSEPMFTPSSGESAKTNTDQPVESEETAVAESQPPPANEPQIVPSSSDAIDVVESSVETVPTEIAGKAAPSIAEEARPEKAGQSEVPQLDTTAERSSSALNESVVEEIPESMKNLMAFIEADTDSEGDNEDDSTTSAVANSNTGPGGSDLVSSESEKTRTASSSDTVHVAQPATDAKIVAETTGTEKAADITLAVETAAPEKSDHPEVPELLNAAPERTSSVVDGSASKISEEDVVPKSQPPTLILQEEASEPAEEIGRPIEVKDEPPDDELIPESMKNLMAYIEADTDSEDDTEGDSPTLPVEAAVTDSGTGSGKSPTNQKSVTNDQGSSGSEARPVSLSDTDHVAQSSEINAGSTGNSSSVEKSTGAEPGRTSSVVDRSTVEPSTIFPSGQSRTLILQEEASEPAEESRRPAEVEEEPPDEESIPECMKNLMTLIETDTDNESDPTSTAKTAVGGTGTEPDRSPANQNGTTLDQVSSESEAPSASSSDAARVARPSAESTSASAKMTIDSHIKETGRPGGEPLAVPSSNAVIQTSVEPVQPRQNTIVTPIETTSTPSNATLLDASLAGNSSQASNSDRPAAGVSGRQLQSHKQVEDAPPNQIAVVEDQIVPRGAGESIAVPQVPSVNSVTDSRPKQATAKIQLRRWSAHHRILEPVVQRHVVLHGTLRKRWPQLFQRTPTTQFSDIGPLNEAITATLFNALNPTDMFQAFELRSMVDALAIRIVLGITSQELCSLQRAANPRRSPLVERNWEIVLTTSGSVGDDVPTPSKRIKVSENGSSGFSLQSNSSVVICLSDSEDSPTLRLPVRKKRRYRVRQN